MIRFTLFLLCLLIACAATKFAATRRIAEGRLQQCRRETDTLEGRETCYRSEHLLCTAAGLEKTCGEGW